MSRKLIQVEMDFTMTTQEPVEQVMAMEVEIITGLSMIPTTICPTTIEVFLQVKVRDHVLLTRRMHHRCAEKPLSTTDIPAEKIT
jgi:hypothetical protein